MTTATINGTPLISLRTRMPRTGVWFADAVADQATPLAGKVSISIGDGALVLSGTVIPTRSGVWTEAAHARVLGGAGGLSTPVPAKWWRQATARIVVLDILQAAGETLSQTADSTILGTQLTGWAHKTMPAADALARLVDWLGAIWRVLPDGTVWIGNETWPAAADPGTLLWTDPERQRSRYGAEVPAILPGTSIGSQYISLVEHSVQAGAVETVVSWETAPTDEDRATRAERAIFTHFVARFEWLGVWSAKVVKQNANGTLELQMDDPAMPGLTQVPMQFGLPGIVAVVPSGTRVRVEFAGGDPGQPEVRAFEAGAPVHISFVGTDNRFGSDNASKALALADAVKAQLDALSGAFSSWTPVPEDGGAALKTQIGILQAGPPVWPGSVASSVVQASS